MVSTLGTHYWTFNERKENGRGKIRIPFSGQHDGETDDDSDDGERPALHAQHPLSGSITYSGQIVQTVGCGSVRWMVVWADGGASLPASDCTGSAAHITITSSTFSVQIFVHFIGNVNWHRFNCCRNCCHRHHHHYHSQVMPFVFISLDCNIALGGTEAGKGVRVKVEPDFTPYCFDIRHPTLQFCPFPFPLSSSDRYIIFTHD